MTYNPSLNWMEQVKHSAQELAKAHQYVLEGYITSVDPNAPFKVRVMLEPYEIETGWLKIGTPYLGNGFGLILPPPEENTPVKVIFDMGDLSSGTVIACVPNDNISYPSGVDSQTMGLIHKSGSFFKISSDGTVTIKGKNQTQSW